MSTLPSFVKKPQFVLSVLWRMIKSVRVKYLDDPTRDWERNPSRELVVDLKKGTLCEIGLGEEVDTLSFFGPCEEFTRLGPAMCVDEEGKFLSGESEGSYVISYGSMGLSIHFARDSTIKFFSVTSIPDEREPSTKPYSGTFSGSNGTALATELGDFAGVTKFLGDPDRDFDRAGAGWTRSKENPYGSSSSREITYEHDSSTCQVSFDENNMTQSILVMQMTDQDPDEMSQESEKIKPHV